MSEEINGKISANVNGNGEQENGRESLPDRNKKGQFQPGNPGGPGRPRKQDLGKAVGSDLLDNVIAKGLKAEDGRERAAWARVALAYNKQTGKKDDNQTLDPMFMPLLDLLWRYCDVHREKTGECISMLEAIDHIRKHMQTCPSSPMSDIEFDDFVEVADD
jgi:hypothetical protein